MGKTFDGGENIPIIPDVNTNSERMSKEQWNKVDMAHLNHGTETTVVSEKPPAHVAELKTQLASNPEQSLQATLQRTKDIEDAIAKGDRTALLKLAEDHAKDMKRFSDLVSYNTKALSQHQDNANQLEIVGV